MKTLLLLILLVLNWGSGIAQGFRTRDTIFFSPGNIQSITYYNNKLRDSTVYYSKKTDEKSATFIYKGNGSEGTWIGYDKEGNKVSKYDVSNNKTTGLAVYYHKNGKVYIEENFENNLRQGKATMYFENGAIRWQGMYKNNKLNGASIHYYKNGKLQFAGIYKNGKMRGERKCYTEYGTPCDGFFIIRDEQNLPEREGLCRNGKPEGTVKQYNKGVLVKMVTYKNGKPDGLTYRYKDNKVISTELYKNGKFKKEIKEEPNK
ncbi:MAG TPA: hypothetical protein VF411_07585 [Bacteroidia bacterium]